MVNLKLLALFPAVFIVLQPFVCNHFPLHQNLPQFHNIVGRGRYICHNEVSHVLDDVAT